MGFKVQQVHAYAKLNLFLQVVGKRPNGYHELESAIIFTDIADGLTFTAAKRLSLSITGPYAKGLHQQENIIIRAAHALQHYVQDTSLAVAITLDKHIPVGAGLGGGSADAAATLRVLNRYWKLGLPDEVLYAIGIKLGADVPVCLYGKSAWVSGIGEHIRPLDVKGAKAVLLVNPGSSLATAQVFQALTKGQWSGAVLADIKMDVIGNIARLKNDLQSAAISLVPEIQEVVNVLHAQAGCSFARMSGSGATCFGWFETIEEMKRAARLLSKKYPKWWVRGTQML
jgi:4-diphosphocytidyl-2-C-methyl-D-erythritol kinase